MTTKDDEVVANQNPRGAPTAGDQILVRGLFLRAWFVVSVREVAGNDIVTGSGMGTRVVDVRRYGKDWKWPRYPRKTGGL